MFRAYGSIRVQQWNHLKRNNMDIFRILSDLPSYKHKCPLCLGPRTWSRIRVKARYIFTSADDCFTARGQTHETTHRIEGFQTTGHADTTITPVIEDFSFFLPLTLLGQPSIRTLNDGRKEEERKQLSSPLVSTSYYSLCQCSSVEAWYYFLLTLLC
jgi:hypothetical protein